MKAWIYSSYECSGELLHSNAHIRTKEEERKRLETVGSVKNVHLRGRGGDADGGSHLADGDLSGLQGGERF